MATSNTFLNRTSAFLVTGNYSDRFRISLAILVFASTVGLSRAGLFLEKYTFWVVLAFVGIVLSYRGILLNGLKDLKLNFPRLVVFIITGLGFLVPSVVYFTTHKELYTAAYQILVCSWETMTFGYSLPTIVLAIFSLFMKPRKSIIVIVLALSTLAFTLLHLRVGYDTQQLLWVFLIGLGTNFLGYLMNNPSFAVMLHFVNNMTVLT
jgi:membrane protease YdiL (CAAX protease family)